MCFGGSVPASQPAPAPPQAAQMPNVATIRANSQAQTVGSINSTLLTGSSGGMLNNNQLGKISLLGQ